MKRRLTHQEKMINNKCRYLIETTICKLKILESIPMDSSKRLKWAGDVIFTIQESERGINKLRSLKDRGIYEPSMQDVEILRDIISRINLLNTHLREEFLQIYRGKSVYQEYINLACRSYTSYGKIVNFELLDEKRDKALNLFRIASAIQIGSIPRRRYRKLKYSGNSNNIRENPEIENRLLEMHREQLETLSERVAQQRFRAAFSHWDMQPRSQFRRFRN